MYLFSMHHFCLEKIGIALSLQMHKIELQPLVYNEVLLPFYLQTICFNTIFPKASCALWIKIF